MDNKQINENWINSRPTLQTGEDGVWIAEGHVAFSPPTQ